MNLTLQWACGAQILMSSTSTPHLSSWIGSGLMTHFSEFSSSEFPSSCTTWRHHAVASVSLKVQILHLNPHNYVQIQQQTKLHAKLNIIANQASLNYKQILCNFWVMTMCNSEKHFQSFKGTQSPNPQGRSKQTEWNSGYGLDCDQSNVSVYNCHLDDAMNTKTLKQLKHTETCRQQLWNKQLYDRRR
jgi:hypothetical protein